MRQTFRLRRLHLLGSDACIIWARMPASTLHKSAQQEAPDTCIFHVQEHNSRHARPKDARVNPLWRTSKKMPASSTSYARGKIRAPPPRRAYRDARATSYARLRHTCVALLLRAQKMAAPAWTHAKLPASPPATRVAKMRASKQLQGS